MATLLQLAGDDPALLAAVQRARKLLNRRALTGAAAGVVPVPGLDWVMDTALLARLIPAISAEFGLTPEQLARLSERKREQVEQAAGAVGSVVIGKSVTRDLMRKAAAVMAKRLAIRQAARYVPLAGQAVSAVIGYTAIRKIGEQHIRDCVEVWKQTHVPLPQPQQPASLPALH